MKLDVRTGLAGWERDAEEAGGAVGATCDHSELAGMHDDATSTRPASVCKQLSACSSTCHHMHTKLCELHGGSDMWLS